MINLINVILGLCVVYIIYEILKIVFIQKFWKMCSSERTKFILIVDGIYSILLVFIAFTKYWYVALIVLLLSLVTAFIVSRALRQKSSLNKRVMSYMIVDGILSILALSLPIICECIL